MLSRIFGSNKRPSPKPRGGKENLGLKKATSDVARDREVMRSAQRELYSFDRPEQELGMTDLLKKHEDGNRFLYAAVTAKQDEEDSSRLRRLIQQQPKLSRKAVPLNKLPILSLYQETETFGLSSLLPKGKTGNDKTYIHISEVLIIYGSLISSDSVFSKVRVCIVDNRLIQNKIAKSYVANTNVISKATMSLSYSFPRDEVEQISLTLSRESAFLEEGMQWGAAQVMIQMEETEFPIQTYNSDVRAINAIPQSMLEQRDVDPDFIDISLTENNRKALRELYMGGDLADETAPIQNKSEMVKYAKSSLAGPKGKKPIEQANSEWSFMNDKRQVGMEAGYNSVEPSEDGEVEEVNTQALKSAMKKRVGFMSERPLTPPPTRGQDEEEAVVTGTPLERARRVEVEEPNSSLFY